MRILARSAVVASTMMLLGATLAHAQGQLPAGVQIYYTLPTDLNTVPVNPGGSIPVPQTIVNTFTTVGITVYNAGPNAVTFQSASVSGADFQLINLPLLPASLKPGQEGQFSVRYVPLAAGTSTGSMSITVGSDTATFELQGTSVLSNFLYQLIVNGTTATITPNQTISLPDTAVGQFTTFSIKVVNNFNTALQIGSIAINGPFKIISAPILPDTVPAGGSVVVTAQFVPTQIGATTGFLIIGSDTFVLTGNGTGAQRVYSYSLGGTNTPITPGGTITLTPVQIGQSGQAQFSIQNTGTTADTVTNININQSSSVFSLTNVPALPITIAPGQTVSFTITDNPIVVGSVTATLSVDNDSFTLSGSGTTPAALPAYTFSGASGTVPPQSQQTVGLALTKAYPLALTGTLQMLVNAEPLSSDPAVQFATGGRTVTFTIAANSTQAVFVDGSTQVGFQTGTVASTISFVPAFSTQSGVVVTPLSPPSQTVTVAPGAPQLLYASVQGTTISTTTASATINLAVTGYVTTRTLQKLTFQFTPASGYKLATSSFTIDVTGAAGTWFSSTASQSFGSQFVVTVPFTLSVSSSTTSITSILSSVSVTATNEQGTSAAVTTAIY